jgi:hypothetical protein
MEPQQRRPRPDLGCSDIGWMDGPQYIAKKFLSLEYITESTNLATPALRRENFKSHFKINVFEMDYKLVQINSTPGVLLARRRLP